MVRLVLFVFLGLNAVGLGALGWFTLRTPEVPAAVADAPPAPEMRSVLVAVRNLRGGSLLKPEDVMLKELPVTALPSGAAAEGPGDRNGLNGAMIRRSLVVDEVLLPSDLLRPGEHGFLAAVLRPGMRAISVGVDAIRGSAGLIWPGDRVDLVLTQQLDNTVPMARRFVGETVLTDVRVIAIDQNLVQGAMESADLHSQARTVTFEVTPQQGERVAVASRLGVLSLVVRSAVNMPEDQGFLVGEQTRTWGGDVSPALGASVGNNVTNSTIRVYQGVSKSEEVRF